MHARAWRFRIPASFLFALLLCGATTAEAQTPRRIDIVEEPNVLPQQDFLVAPARFPLSLDAGQQQVVTITIISRTDGWQTYHFEAEDAGPDASGNGVQLFGTNDGPYSARTWLEPDVPSVRLRFGQRATIPVTVRVPADADPGDHYAALLIRQEPDEAGPQTVGVTIVSRVGALFYVSVSGDVVREASLLRMQAVPRLSLMPDVRLDMEGRNTGTVLATPEGDVTIRNLLGSTVATLPVRGWNLLRGGTGVFSVRWQPAFAIGRYTATADIEVFGKETARASVSFWVLPPLPVILALMALILFGIAIRYASEHVEIRVRKKRAGEDPRERV